MLGCYKCCTVVVVGSGREKIAYLVILGSFHLHLQVIKHMFLSVLPFLALESKSGDGCLIAGFPTHNGVKLKF